MGLRKNPEYKKTVEKKQTPSKNTLQLRCIIHTQLHNRRLQLEAQQVVLANLDQKYHKLGKIILSALIKSSIQHPKKGLTLDKRIQQSIQSAFSTKSGITKALCMQLHLCSQSNFIQVRDTLLKQYNLPIMKAQTYTINRYFEKKGILNRSTFNTGYNVNVRKTHTLLQTLLHILEKISQAFENCTQTTHTKPLKKAVQKPQKRPQISQKRETTSKRKKTTRLEQKIIAQADKIPGISRREMTKRLNEFKKHFNTARNYLLYGRFTRGIDREKRIKYGITPENITIDKYLPLVFTESMFDKKTFDPTRRSNNNTFGYFQLYKAGKNFPAAVEIRHIFGLSRISLGRYAKHFDLTNKTHNIILGILYYQICEKKSDLTKVMVRYGEYKSVARLSNTDRLRLTRAIYNKGDYVRRIWINMHPTPRNYHEFEQAISKALFASMNEHISADKRAIHPHHKFMYQELGAVAKYKDIIENLKKKYLDIKKPKMAIYKRKRAALAKRPVYLNFKIKGKITPKKIRFPLGQLIEMLDYVRVQEGITALKLPKSAPTVKYAQLDK